MQETMENYSSVNNSTATVTSAHETCAQFIAYVRERYPNLNQIKYKISRNGRHLSLRASYRQRRIHANGFDFERTINTFYFYLMLKLSIDKYYPTVEEMCARRPQEQRFMMFQCEISQTFNN